MKLRTKTIITIVLLALLIFAAMQLVTFLVIQPSFSDLENHESRAGVQQAIHTINYRLSEFERKVRDYSSWNDTYEFAKDENPEYIESNFVDETFENLNLNLIAITNNSKILLYCQSFDVNASVKVPTSEEMRNALGMNKVLNITWN